MADMLKRFDEWTQSGAFKRGDELVLIDPKADYYSEHMAKGGRFVVTKEADREGYIEVAYEVEGQAPAYRWRTKTVKPRDFKQAPDARP